MGRTGWLAITWDVSSRVREIIRRLFHISPVGHVSPWLLSPLSPIRILHGLPDSPKLLEARASSGSNELVRTFQKQLIVTFAERGSE